MVTDLFPFVRPLLAKAFPPSPRAAWHVEGMAEIGRGRGVFSTVVRATLVWTAGSGPASVVVKAPDPGPNGEAAITSGACRREALAYGELLASSPIAHPSCYWIERNGDAASFVLEDLSALRSVDQLDGLDAADATAIVESLARLHHRWIGDPGLSHLNLRRATPSALDPAALTPGLAALGDRWADAAGPEVRLAFERLVANRAALVDAFAAADSPTLCHGDPRADNVAFDASGRPILYDWQQIAIQFGVADLAWLTATSLDPSSRRAWEEDLVKAYGTTIDRYRLALVLPGLAVLFLAQRSASSDRSNRLIATSIARIGAAIADLEVAAAH